MFDTDGNLISLSLYNFACYLTKCSFCSSPKYSQHRVQAPAGDQDCNNMTDGRSTTHFKGDDRRVHSTGDLKEKGKCAQ